jgi:hypothetical protein
MPATRSHTAYYVDTPQGIFTAAGTWFRTSEALLEAYAAPLLAHRPLTYWLEQADRWLQLPLLVFLWTLPPLLGNLKIPIALGMSLGLYVITGALLPLVILPKMAGLLHFLAKPWLVGLYYVASLSLLAWQGMTAAVWVGLAGFVLGRWQLLDRLLRPLWDRGLQGVYRLPLPDRVLRSVLVRAALSERVPLPELRAMERNILNHLHAQFRK